LSFDKILNIVEMPSSYKNHIETKIDSLLFKNPSMKKYVQYNGYSENTIEYNLQPRNINNNAIENLHSNYSNELYKKLPLSIYENLQMREVDNYRNL
jgi:hypothetical protein